MRILITGANGQLGQDFQKLFTKKNIEFFPTDFGTDIEDLDITDRDAISKYIQDKKIELIVNCAAYNAVDNAETDKEMAFKINGEAVKNLALEASKSMIDLVHYSTDFVFDGKKGSSYTTDDLPSPLSQYGKSKLQGEHHVINLHTKYFLIRTSWVFGLGNVNFVKKVINWSKGRTELSIVTDQISSPSYTVDLATATLELIKAKAYGFYHMTNSGVCSRYEWAKYILEQIRWKGELKEAKSSDFQTAAQRPEYSALDNSSLKEIIGYDLPNWKDATKRFLQELGYST
ncbi:MAG: dTDP-4-dehydrorhamnose reductase [Asgard group archaeon]|nr:dTDP-4-dehydrorhamnose reductase [Asgard group archaeon]